MSKLMPSGLKRMLMMPQKHDATEAKAQEETATAVAVEVGASVEATVESVGIEHGLGMPPVPGMHVPMDVTGTASMDVEKVIS